MKKGILYRFSLIVAPWLFMIVPRLLFATCRIEIDNAEYLDEIDKTGKTFIAAFWHYGVLCTLNNTGGRRFVAMVSGSRDGEFVAKILEKSGFETVRGSRYKGGLKALKTMEKIMGEKELNAAIVADGSQGPARKVQAGVILLASKTGAPILPFGWSAERYWVFRSWDRTILPKPFSRVTLQLGEPLFVAEGIRSKDLEVNRLELEKRLEDIYQESWAKFNKEEH